MIVVYNMVWTGSQIPTQGSIHAEVPCAKKCFLSSNRRFLQVLLEASNRISIILSILVQEPAAQLINARFNFASYLPKQRLVTNALHLAT